MTTQHNHPMVFGRRHEGCHRCQELNAGAKPIVWASTQRRIDEQARMIAIRTHNCVASRCGAVCTAFDW